MQRISEMASSSANILTLFILQIIMPYRSWLVSTRFLYSSLERLNRAGKVRLRSLFVKNGGLKNDCSISGSLKAFRTLGGNRMTFKNDLLGRELN